MVLWSRSRVLAAPVASNGRERTLAWLWVGVMLLPHHRFTQGRTPLDAAQGNLSVENILELAVLVGIGAWAAWNLLSRPAPLRFVQSAAFLVLPTLALSSAAWSITPLVSLGRGLEIASLSLLGLLTAAWFRLGWCDGDRLLTMVVRRYIDVVSLLVSIGFVFPDWPYAGRYTWPGLDTGVAAMVAGIGLLGLLVVGRHRLRLTGFGFVARVALLGAAVVLSRTRSVWGALAVAIFAALLIGGVKSRIPNRAAALFSMAALSIPIVAFRNDILVFLQRGEGPASFHSLDGRLPLWTFGLSHLREAGRTALGFGLGGSRIVLFGPQSIYGQGLPAVRGTAESTWVQALLDLGVLGLTATVVTGCVLLLVIPRLRHVSRLALQLGTAFVCYLLVISVISDVLLAPGVAYATLCLIGALAIGASRSPQRRIQQLGAERLLPLRPVERPPAKRPRERSSVRT
jgi:O-antigen ligase